MSELTSGGLHAVCCSALCMSVVLSKHLILCMICLLCCSVAREWCLGYISVLYNSPGDMWQIWSSLYHKSMKLGALVPFQKWSHCKNATWRAWPPFYFPPWTNDIFCIISPQPNMISQIKWCLPLYCDGQGLQWYHIAHHKLLRWIDGGEFNDILVMKLQYLRT